jgi:hypothetical protein
MGVDSDAFKWGTLAAIVTVLATIGASAAWFFSYTESSEQAARREQAIRADVQVESQRLRNEAKADRLAMQRAQAWAAVATKRLELLVLRNRVNDCHAIAHKSSVEASACKQYEDEFAEATDAHHRLIQSATELSRTQ